MFEPRNMFGRIKHLKVDVQKFQWRSIYWFERNSVRIFVHLNSVVWIYQLRRTKQRLFNKNNLQVSIVDCLRIQEAVSIRGKFSAPFRFRAMNATATLRRMKRTFHRLNPSRRGRESFQTALWRDDARVTAFSPTICLLNLEITRL